MYITVWVKLK